MKGKKLELCAGLGFQILVSLINLYGDIKFLEAVIKFWESQL